MKRMMFNAAHDEELRVAIVDGQKLVNLDIETEATVQQKGNIYLGVITRVEPSLEAVFVSYGGRREGFLPLKEISRRYFNNPPEESPSTKVRIQNVVENGQKLIVQIEKGERGTKGAALTTFISLAGRYLVLLPNNHISGGVSRQISGEERTNLKNVLAQLKTPEQHSVIIRTAGIGKSLEELQWDLDFLDQVWLAIEKAGAEQEAPRLLYQESNLVVRSLRDYLRRDVSEILIDQEATYNQAKEFIQVVMPQNLSKLKHYQDNVPLFSRFQIEHQIEAAFSRKVTLPSGGAIVIDHTEALISIDVNSARSTKGADISETALHTNFEAVEEIAKQLRLRDIGGLIVIDLIDMNNSKSDRLVEERFKEATKVDRARIHMSRISKFGLLEASRQRLRPSIGEHNYIPCPRCEGSGQIRTITSSALGILRIIEEDALKENTEAIQAHLPIETATYLLNEKRNELQQIENRLGTRIVLVPSADLDHPHYRIKRIRSDEVHEIATTPSYQMSMEAYESSQTVLPNRKPRVETPAVQLTITHQAAPEVSGKKKSGILDRIIGAVFKPTHDTTTGRATTTKPEQKKATPPQSQPIEGDKPAPRTKQPFRRGGPYNRRRNTRRGGGQNNKDTATKDQATKPQGNQPTP